MKFSDFYYERPDFLKIKTEYNFLLKNLNNSINKEEEYEYILQINKIRNNIFSLNSISMIRHTINTNDKFYNNENDYWNEYSPYYKELDNKFYKIILKSKNRNFLEKKLSKQFFNIAENSIKTFHPNIIKDLQLENNLTSQYQKLIASANIYFKGEFKNLSNITPYTLNNNRKTRKEALEAKYNFFKENEKKIDEIYHNLVQIRDKISKKLGYKNFVELGYIRMNRNDYNPQMVSNFREQVKRYIVPIANDLFEKQRKKLALETLTYYDQNYEFTTGNPIPKGDVKWIIENGGKMYSELSKETKEFFDFMTENELMDLETKDGKASIGYCDYICKYKSPFIFTNFNGTKEDIAIFTHEVGHAFQAYRSRWIEVPELNFPTYESSEIHSMSMEFFTWPWMELFFKENTDKYKFSHLGKAIKFIPYGVTVDHFQHKIYENPNLTPKERKKIWRDLEKEYLPHKNYEECDFLENGGWWFQQSHIFQSPFYYIDYTLAQICALQFFKKMNNNREEAWQDYITLCDLGGTKSFLELVAHANLKSPFDSGTVESIIEDIKKSLDMIENNLSKSYT